MLKELVEYYDCVTNQPNTDFVPDGYSKVSNVAYKIVLTKDGKLKDILPNTRMVDSGNKTKEVGYDETFPFSKSFPGIKAKEVIDFREKYILGFDDWSEETKSFVFSENGSIKAFRENKNNISFFDDISSPVIDAYKNFLMNWVPENEIRNPVLSIIAKKYKGAKFIIVVEGYESREKSLNQDKSLNQKWLMIWNRDKLENSESDVYGQCSVSGEVSKIERIHNKLTGVKGGKSEVNLVCFNEESNNSYGKSQSYNSSVSTAVMEKYTKAFNYLSSSKAHKRMIDDMTLLFWANTREKEAPYLEDFLCELLDADEELERMVKEASEGNVTDRTDNIDENIEFCVLGVKPNTSRLAIKIFEKDSFGNIISRITRHQEDMRLGEDDNKITMWQITNELKSPKSKEDTVPPDLSAKLLTAILKNRPYPEYLLQTVVRRAKIDKDDEKTKFKAINSRRARIIKACLLRSKYYKGDEYMIDSKNQTDAFRCGRIFAVLEMIQKEALGDINATVKDKFFASACSTPNLVFARLIKLAQPHLKKIENDNKKYLAIYFDKILQDLLGEMEGFPKTLSLQQQGDFILGYYQQKHTKKKNDEGENE